MSKESRTLSSRDEEPIINYLGEGKFKFKSQDAACYMHPLGWVADNNRGGISLCFTTEEENCLALFKLTGVQPVPVYTPEMATASSNALKAAGIMALSRAPGAIQFSIAGSGVLTPVTQVASAVSGAIARALAALAATATASTAGPIAAAVVMGMWPSEAGQGSDKWNGQNLALLSLPLTTLSGKQTVLPGRPTIDLPARGSLMMNGNQLEFKLLKTGGALSKAVPVLNAVRDAVTGLDSIIIPAMGGVPERTILINPAPTGPMFPPHTGNSSPKPVTPVHTGTTIETIDKPLILTTPVPDETFDFIYWQLDAKGSGVEPVYVVVSSNGDASKGFNQTEIKIINEAQGILDSKVMDQIKQAHSKGQAVTVVINNRIIQYEPNLPASGMTMFGDNGFYLGPEAFKSKVELQKTVLHELYRLNTSNSGNGVSEALASQETYAAYDFAEKASSTLRSK
ncbi:S-type pyocin domain-containing protein [Pragia fontium]|uniref:S-type Pyocin n=1 Tax=Pragia fontium DSM 5563 = ATCC 49100 TaxID=1122977 RepID=A0AAJ4WB01_9GAMM|nr:S-type pyocin domain-containing protein [Pragia fontium]SFC90712.1 S-type Pyocin [Pragia fontium DSM 5563 = ATCC 49100]VEJ55956.1 Colicin-D [Pragia fontium]